MRMRYYALLLFMTQTFAITNLGVAQLVFPKTVDYITITTSKADPRLPKISKLIINDTQQKLNSFPQKLLTLDLESGVKLYSAESVVQTILKKNPNFLETLKVEALLVESQPKAANQLMAAEILNAEKKSPRPIILIGFVNWIRCSLNEDSIMQSGYISWLYTLDINIKFRIFDANTLKPIYAFSAVGQTGIAKIITKGTPNVEFKPTNLADSALNALMNNTWHEIKMFDLRK